MSDRTVEIFEPEHLEELGVKNDVVVEAAKITPAYTFMVDGKVAGCFGILPLWEGVAEIWSVPGPLIKKYPFTYYRGSIKIINEFIKFYGLKRLQATCIKTNETSFKWLKRLGFVEEGIMRKYHNGEDHYRLAKVI